MIVDAYPVFADKTRYETCYESCLRHKSIPEAAVIEGFCDWPIKVKQWLSSSIANLLRDTGRVLYQVSDEITESLLPVQLAQQPIGLVEPAHAVRGPARIGMCFASLGLVGLADRRDRDRGAGLC